MNMNSFCTFLRNKKKKIRKLIKKKKKLTMTTVEKENPRRNVF